MSYCDRIVDTGSYFDGEMEADAASAFEGHLEACPSCRDELNAIRGLRPVLGLIQPEAEILQRVRNRVFPSWWRRPVRVPQAVAAGVAFALVLSLAVNLMLLGRVKGAVSLPAATESARTAAPQKRGLATHIGTGQPGNLRASSEAYRLEVNPSVRVIPAASWGADR